MKIDPTFGQRAQAIAGKQLETIASGVDAMRLEGLRHAQTAAEARVDALRQERARLVAKYGADAPQVALADARIETQQGVVTRARADIERAEMPRPQFGGNVAVIYGRVVDDGGTGLSGYTVLARDAREAARGRALSGERGAFQITLDGGAVEREAPRVRRKAKEPVASAEASSGGASAGGPVTLEVSKGKNVVARRDEALEVQPGTAAYVELVVPSGGANTVEPRASS
jgi:hypothetical protein